MSSKIDSVTTEQNRHSIMSSVSSFKSAVVKIRDILRGPGVCITGMESMRHICLYLLSRYITREKAASLEVPEKFAWENLIECTYLEDGGVQRALDRFYHKDADVCLVDHFDRLFGTQNFSFDIKHIQKHSDILKILNQINMSEVDCEIDMLGWVYEQHLKTGSSSAGRDLGQFFTDRFICEYMTKLCDPKFKMEGVPESVCDPSMGTGGFLTYYIKYFNKKYPGQVNWKVQEQVIHGNDTDPRVAGVARLNLFMETGGFCATNLRTHDSLYGDLTQTGYDVILANMPFGLKGIKHADCCNRVKDLKIRGTKSEPLFLQLMMVSLNPGGRCAVVVPDGMLVNSSTCHDDTRKYLMDHFELKRVIKLKGKFFMNTGIQPSVLFFENTGKPTTAVEFWEVIKGEDGKVQEEMILSVPRERFTDACCLDVRKYQEVKVAANPAGFPMVKLGDISELCRNNTQIVDDTSGEFIKYFGPKIVGRCSNYQFDGEYILTPNRQSIGLLGYVNEKFTATHTFVIKVNQHHSAKYVYYYLLLNDNLSEKSKGIIPYIKNEDILTLSVIIPPLPVQQEIVATLDRIYQPGTTELSETLKLTSRAMDLVLAQPNGTMLEPIVEAQRMMRKSAQMAADVKAQMAADVKAQMAAIVKSVGCRGFPMMKLGDLYEIPKGIKKFNSGDIDNTGDASFFNGKWDCPVGFHSEHSYTSSKDYFVGIKDGGGDHTSDVVGMGKLFKVTGKCAVTSHNIILVQKTELPITHNYIYYYMSLKIKELRDKARYSLSLGSISVGDFLDFEITLPPLDFQQAVLVRLDALQSQLASLETLSKQAEDNARFILESYLGTA